MRVDIAAQGQALLQALGLGLAAGGLYDLLRILRVRIPLRLLSHSLDFLFWMAVTLSIFLWSHQAWGGNIRI